MKRNLIIVLAFMITVGSVSCSNSQGQKSSENSSLIPANESASIAKNVAPTQFQKFIQQKKDAIILDVRTPQEVAQGKISGSVNIDFMAPEFKEKLNKLDKSKPVLVYCAVGGRSGKTMQLLNDKGFKEVYNLSGGIREWKNQGMPTK